MFYVGSFNFNKDERCGDNDIDVSQELPVRFQEMLKTTKYERLHFCEFIPEENKRRSHPRAKYQVHAGRI